MSNTNNLLSNNEIISALAASTDVSKDQIKTILSSLVDIITTGLLDQQLVRISGLGQFSLEETSARSGRNPSTGAALNIPASRRVKFKVSKTLKDKAKTQG